MSKLFKNSKQILALVIAFAILAVSLFAGSIVASAEETAEEAVAPLCGGSKTLFWDGTYDSNLADKGETGDKNNPIIIDNAAELNYMSNHLTGSTTKGKYYKMADDIKYVILQPQSVASVDNDANGVYDILELADGNATKTFFEETITPVNWSSRDAETWFANHFDGNGVIFVGMYSKSRSAGLFPTADGGASFSNFAVVNSYIHGALKYNSSNGKWEGQCRTGSIVGGTCGVGYGAKVSGDLNFDNVMVINNYLRAELSTTAAGILWGACNDEEIGHINNAVVYGNVGYFGKPDATTLTPLHLFNGNKNGADPNTVTNSVILGTTPYPSSYAKNTAGVECFENVITDANVAPWDKSADYKDTDLLSVADLSGYKIVEKYKDMFKTFHGEIVALQDVATHGFECEDCGYKFLGASTHNWNEDYVCADCEYVCIHTDATFDDNFAGDCVTDPGTKWHCNLCGRTDYTSSNPAPGHDLEWVDEIVADCENTGREGYWHCTVCGSNFAGDKDMQADLIKAPMDTSVDNPDAELVTPIAPHAAFDRTGEDEIVKVVVVGNDGHYWECYTCDGKLLAVESDNIASEGKLKKHKYDAGVCVDCGWECPEHDYQPSGKVLVIGSCTEDRVEELKCTNCGDIDQKVIPSGHKIEKMAEVKATDRLEGTKEHYACVVCKEIYTDAEGKEKATEASLVIPKVLPAGYENIVTGTNNGNTTNNGTNNNVANNNNVSENINADTSTTSPSTRDSVAAVVALATLAGAAIVFARKVK